MCRINERFFKAHDSYSLCCVFLVLIQLDYLLYAKLPLITLFSKELYLCN